MDCLPHHTLCTNMMLEILVVHTLMYPDLSCIVASVTGVSVTFTVGLDNINIIRKVE